MKIIDCIQGSDDWFQARLGKITGSCFGKVLAKGQGKTRKSYMIQLAAERLSGLPQESYSNAVMERGSLIEPQARAAYEDVYGVEVQEVGFVELNENVGVSPDGLVGEDGGVEIKSPNSTTHIETILSGKMPPKHKPQVQGNMWVCGRDWWDFVSFDPRVKDCRIWTIRVERDQEYIDNLSEEVDRFVKELEAMTDKIRAFSPF